MSIFNTEGKFYKGLTWIGNIVFLNLIWLLFSLPIVTIGASTVAAHSVLFKIMDDKEGYLWKNFVKAFKANWKQGTVLWIITLIAGYGIYIEAQVLFVPLFNADLESPAVWEIILGIVGTVLILCSLIYAYPLSARYQNKFYMQIKNSFLLSVHYPLKTLLVLVIIALEIAAMMWNTTTMILIIVVGPMLIITTIAGTARKIFNINEKRNMENGWKPTHVNEYTGEIEEASSETEESNYAENMEILDENSLKK